MTENERPKQKGSRIPSVGMVYALAKQLDKELQRAMHGTVADRDDLISTSSPQLSYLKPILDTLTLRSELREQAICKTRTIFHEQEVPSVGTTRPGMLALELAQAAESYLTASAQDRDRLSTNCHLVFCDVYIQLFTLLIPDRAEREEHVWVNIELAPAVNKAFSSAMQELFGKKQRHGRR